MGVLVVVWFFLTYRKELLSRPGLALVMLIGLLGLGVFTAYQMRDTVLMQRFLLLEEAELESSASSRMTMIREAVALTFQNPLFGVGLNNFRFHSMTGLYAHNNYAEVFATTGIPGGLLYHAIYVLILWRLFTLRKFVVEPAKLNMLTILMSLMMMSLIFDLFVVSYYSKITWIFLAIIIGYSASLVHDLQSGSDSESDAGVLEASYPAEES
jgi:O-antigen ligase